LFLFTGHLIVWYVIIALIKKGVKKVWQIYLVLFMIFFTLIYLTDQQHRAIFYITKYH
jgi:hypothetical protein